MMTNEAQQSIADNPQGFGQPPERGGIFTYLTASFGQMMIMMLRQNRLILVAVITFLPVVIPLAIAFLSRSAFADEGNVIFVELMEKAHINTLAPLLALFFASMLVGEDVEMQVLPYVLTRPQPRSTWVLGRFIAYMVVASTTLFGSILLTFAGCTALTGLHFDADGLTLLAEYSLVAFMALLTYGALAAFLGAYTKRPIVYGVLLLYGWQRFALIIPGIIDFLTIEKYTDALLPKLATASNRREVQTVLGTYSKEFFEISATYAFCMLLTFTVLFIGLSIWAVRNREYAASRAVGG